MLWVADIPSASSARVAGASTHSTHLPIVGSFHVATDVATPPGRGEFQLAVVTSQIQVADRNGLESTITGYIAQGFLVQNRGHDFAIMFKKKEFSVLWAVIGFVICIIPLVVYLIVYATQKDELVEIRVVGAGGVGPPVAIGAGWSAASRAQPDGVQYSPDGRYWWDVSSARWVPVAGGAGDAGGSGSDEVILRPKPQG